MEAKLPSQPFGKLSQPALRALANAGIINLQQLSQYTESDLLKLHGMGKASIPALKASLAAQGLAFKSSNA